MNEYRKKNDYRREIERLKMESKTHKLIKRYDKRHRTVLILASILAIALITYVVTGDTGKVLGLLVTFAISIAFYSLLKVIYHRIVRTLYLFSIIATAITTSYFMLTDQFSEAGLIFCVAFIIAFAIMFIYGENVAVNVRIIRED